jgi:hypothetical protein
MKPFTKVEVTILEAGERPLGVKVWNDCCWVGDEWLGRMIVGSTANHADSLVARGHLRRKGEWISKFETTETGLAALAAHKEEKNRG